ncbi:MAG: GIY-YIG nuclease family protein [Dehalococcoidia bacterium]|nr:GIY-YIG nuclease family protein [Dehalococcoidia bacterium]
MSDWYLYLIRCRDGTLYTGISTDVDRRFAQHQGPGNAGSRYLRGRGPLSLVFRERLGSKSLALKVERKVKRMPKARKEKLVKVSGNSLQIVNGARRKPSGHRPVPPDFR